MDMCVVLSSPSNGDIVLSNGTAMNSQAQYTCDRGYVLVGNTTRICGPDGWTGEEPTCVGKYMYEQQLVANYSTDYRVACPHKGVTFMQRE